VEKFICCRSWYRRNPAVQQKGAGWPEAGPKREKAEDRSPASFRTDFRTLFGHRAQLAKRVLQVVQLLAEGKLAEAGQLAFGSQLLVVGKVATGLGY